MTFTSPLPSFAAVKVKNDAFRLCCFEGEAGGSVGAATPPMPLLLLLPLLLLILSILLVFVLVIGEDKAGSATAGRGCVAEAVDDAGTNPLALVIEPIPAPAPALALASPCRA